VRKLSYAMILFAGVLCSTARADIVIDLTTEPSTGSGTAVIGGAFRVDQIDAQSTGTGVIEPFLRIQGNGNEMGYNTDANPEYDAKAGSWTHALQLSAVPIVTINTVDYRQFLLDINQNSGGTNEFLALNQIQIFQSPGDVGINSESFINQTAAGGAPPLIQFSNATEVFRMNNATDPNTEIRMNYDLNPGSGGGDMFLYIRNDAFSQTPTSFITLFSHFGTPPGSAASNDGFEEWAVIGTGTTTSAVPEPTSLALLATLVGVVGLLARKRRSTLVQA
jgi:hypothetical protein